MTEEDKFIKHTLYLFKFKDCIALIKEDKTLYKDIDFKAVEEANKLIENGWTPIPF